MSDLRRLQQRAPRRSSDDSGDWSERGAIEPPGIISSGDSDVTHRAVK